MSPFVCAPNLTVSREHHTLYQLCIQVRETADEERAAVSQTGAENLTTTTSYVSNTTASHVVNDVDGAPVETYSLTVSSHHVGMSMRRDCCSIPLSRKGIILVAHGLTAYSVDSIYIYI